MRRLLWIVCALFVLAGCEDTDLQLATEAGVEAVKAVTLSDSEVQQLAKEAAANVDGQHLIAPPGNPYAERLRELVGEHRQAQGYSFNYKVYLAPEVNAFAMADGTIRVYSGLLDLLDDQELRFVIGHEMGHVVKEHLHKKIMLAYAASALRKGVASQGNIAGDLARSGLGDFGQRLLNAQFSQQEERAADDYGLAFMKREGYPPEAAVSALQKLGKLGAGHSFLSSHPAPETRANRLQARLEAPEGASEGGGFLAEAEGIWQSVQEWAAALLEKLQGMFARAREAAA